MSDIGIEIKQRLLALPLGRDANLEGATERDILELENYAGGQFPAVYKQFLKQLGEALGELFRGSDYAVGQHFQLHLKEPAEELLRRMNASFTLPRTAFVFLMSQGYQFTFFDLDDGNDPIVYHYLEGDLAPSVLDTKLSRYLRRCVEACEQREEVRG